MARIACAQLISGLSVEENLKQTKIVVANAKRSKVDLLLLPENFAFLGPPGQQTLGFYEAVHQGLVQESISQLAKQYALWIIAGTIAVKLETGAIKSRSFVYNDKGEVVTYYDKIHLFNVEVPGGETYQESNWISPGHQVVVVDTPVGKVGLSVCYDLRFAELYRALAVQGADILAVPAAFTAKTGQAHWEILLRARAIENQCYVFAANQGGVHEAGRDTYGHSMIIDPWGKILKQRKQGQGLVIADIDLHYLYQVRQVFPCTHHHVLG